MNTATEIESRQFCIEGMCCPNCAVTIKKAVSSVSGVDEVNVDFMSQTMSVTSPQDHHSKIIDIVKSVGYAASIEGININNVTEPAGSVEVKSRLIFSTEIILIAIAALTITTAIIGGMLDMNRNIQVVLIFLTIALAGKPIARKGIIAVRHFRLDMDFLMFIAVVGALLIGEWVEAGMIVVLIAIAELLETASLNRSRRAIESLVKLTPQTAIVLKNSEEVAMPVERINKDDIILIKPGSMIPLDGLVLKGSSSVDQSSITGESIPVAKSAGDLVLAGSINFDGALEVAVSKAAGDTTLDRIIKLVKIAQEQRAPVQTSIDRFAGVYTPIVVGIAVIIAIVPPLVTNAAWSVWIYRSLALLMIACPCAFIISTPVTFVSGLAAAAKRGVLVKGGAFLESLARVKVIAFDKTGTITKGNLVVSDVRSLNGVTPDEILRLAASVESRSEHPIAQSIVSRARSAGLSVIEPEDFMAYPGKGAKAYVDDRQIYVGNPEWFATLNLKNESSLDQIDGLSKENHTSVLIGDDSDLIGTITLTDELRNSAFDTVKQLRNDGMQKIFMLTGDNLQVGKAVGDAVDVDGVMSNLLPEDKVSAVKSLKADYETVAMVGDGVNDAPALATADVGIAMGSRGTDAALETADVVLMGDRLDRLPWLFRLSHKTHRIIVVNIFMAISIKFLFVLLAVTGHATLWMAIFADTGVTLLVIFNGMRALSCK